jgi:hypothetical protein
MGFPKVDKLGSGAIMAALLWHTCVGFLLIPMGGFVSVFDPCTEAEEKVDVTLIVVVATTKNNRIEPKVECIAKAVQKLDPSLTGFRLATTTRETMIVGTRKKFPLVEDQVAIVETKRCTEEPKRVCLSVKAPRMGSITYTSCCGKFFPLLTGYETKGKDRIIIAVMVESCKDEE